jgi:hypothetical protein
MKFADLQEKIQIKIDFLQIEAAHKWILPGAAFT